MHGYYGHTLKLVNKEGKWVYAQFHLLSDQGVKTLTAEKAATVSPDYSTKDLIEAINRKEYPSWTMKVQTMSEEQAQKLFKEKGVNVLGEWSVGNEPASGPFWFIGAEISLFFFGDLTHTWSQKEFPLRTVGKMTLNEVSLVGQRNSRVRVSTPCPISLTLLDRLNRRSGPGELLCRGRTGRFQPCTHGSWSRALGRPGM